jgi:predicted amidohydrolase
MVPMPTLTQRVTAAAIQIGPVEGDVDATLAKCEEWLDRAAGEGADLAVLPEAIIPGFAELDVAHEQKDPHAIAAVIETLDPTDGLATQRLAAKAREHSMVVVFGMLARTQAGKAVNASVLVDETGALRAVHHKMHLTPSYETGVFEPGDSFHVTETRVGRLGQLVCADTSLPETTRILAIQGAQIVCGSFAVFYFDASEWPEGGRQMYLHSHATPTRAIDNGVYFIAANLVGETGGIRYFGRSRIISPAGIVLAEGAEGVDAEELIVADLDPMSEPRLPFSLIDRRRPELYGQILRPNPKADRVRWDAAS